MESSPSLPLGTSVCEKKVIQRATVKLIPVKPGTPTSPLRPGIPGKFIVSPRSPISNKNDHMSGKALI